ncbi:MAG: DNRLRE domain-containing protein [Deltaproteobacteria bacterium]|nr:DNRLRE domain-containing protein [Deltaproteobacteria bacterium]
MANAGPNQVVDVGQTVLLDGSRSFDPDGDKFSYRWKLNAIPADGKASLVTNEDMNTELIPDQAGVWVISLVVDDGKLPSEPDIMQVRAMGKPPCVRDQDCDDGHACTADSCDVNSGDCVNDPTAMAGVECRAVAGICDAAEACDGVNSDCPVDGYADPGTPCRNEVFCDGLETCDSAGACQPGSDPCIGLTCDEANQRCVGCVEDAQCPSCQECDEGTSTCLDQAELSDLKEDCPEAECMTGTCNGLGACGFLFEGTPCGDSSDGECDNADTCDGSGTCLQNHEPVGMACRASAGICDVAELCDGTSAACPADVYDTGTECGPAAGLCDLAEVCDGTGPDCPVNEYIDAGIECRSAAGECDFAELCNGTSAACPADGYLTDETLCSGASGVCCSGACEVGWACCADSGCDDSNECTSDTCLTGTCSNNCVALDCMILNVTTPVNVTNSTPVEVDMCDAGLDVSEFVCFSDRNLGEILLNEDFETGFGDFGEYGNTSLQAVAQNSNSLGNQGVEICADGSGMDASIDTTGRYDIGLKFSVENASLNVNKRMLGVLYYNGSTWRGMILVGDGIAQPYNDYFLVLPPDANDNPDLEVSFYLHGGGAGNGDCAYVDDVQVVDLLPMNTVQTLLSAGFGSGLGPFSEVDPDGNDVNRGWMDGDWRVQIDDNADAHILSDAIDTTSVDPFNYLVVSWDWISENNLDDGKYVLAQYSIDDGVSWNQLGGIGHSYAPGAYTRYSTVLPCEAIGITDLRIRFISPTTCENQDNRGMRVDNIFVREIEHDWVDWFSGMVDMGAGIYLADMTSNTGGLANVVCRFGCGALALWSNRESVLYQGGFITETFGENSTAGLANDYQGVTEDVSVCNWAPNTNYDTGYDSDGHYIQDDCFLWIRFDLSVIPDTATILGVKLHLFTKYRGSTATAQVYELAAASESGPGKNWVETDATWNHFNGTNDWTAGNDGGAGDRGNVFSSLTIPQPPDEQWFSWTLNSTGIAFVQSKLSDDTVNLTLYGTINTHSRQFQSSERENGRRPYLEVTYSW